MMLTSKSEQGFTLVELLVVMTIAMTATALVGGLVVDFVGKYKLKAEVMQLQSLFKKTSQLAFAREVELKFDVTADKIVVRNQSLQVSDQTFEYLTFEKQELFVSRWGTVSQNEFRYLARDQWRTMVLNQ